MEHKTLLDMLSDANEIVKRLSFDDVIKLIETGNTLVIDVREESEVLAGRIKNSIHIPRGLLEFSFELGLDPNFEILEGGHEQEFLFDCAYKIF